MWCVSGVAKKVPFRGSNYPEQIKEQRNAVKGWWEEKMQAGPGLRGEGDGCSCGWGGLGRGELSVAQGGRFETTYWL